MFKYKSKQPNNPSITINSSTNLSKGFYRSKGFIVAAGVALVLGMAVNASSVAIWNFPVLSALIPGVITTAITNQMASLQEKLKIEIKMPDGLPGVTNLKKSLIPYSNENLVSGANLASFSTLTGSFGEGNKMGEMAAYDQKGFEGIATKSYSLPSVTDSSQKYMSDVRDVSLLIAGPASGGDKSDNTKLSLSDLSNKKLGDVQTQARMSSFEAAGSAAYMAQKLKTAASNITIQHQYPEQAIKDMAKLTYYNVMLKAEQLQMQAKEIQRASLINR